MKSVYWFDDLFNADKEFPIPNRDSTTLEDVAYMVKKEEELEAEPKTIAEVLRTEPLAF